MAFFRYLKSFEEVLTFKDKKATDQDLKKYNARQMLTFFSILSCLNTEYSKLSFTKVLNNIVHRHADVVQNMAMGVLQVQETYGIDNKSEQKIQYFLDRFLMSRIRQVFFII